MALRETFVVTKPNQKLISNIEALASKIVNDLFNELDITSDLERMVVLTGRDSFDRDYFVALNSHSSIEDFAVNAALPVATIIPNVRNSELEDIVKRAMDVLAWDASYYMDLFDKNVPMSGASSLIYSPPDDYEGQVSLYNPTPKEIVARAMKPSEIIKL